MADLLRLTFGASTAASAAVLAIFMAGLGFGGLLFGRTADRWRSPLAFYARLEGGIALLAALSPLLLWGVRALYLALGGSAALGGFGSTVVRLVLSALVLGLPTFLMGGTLPAAVRAVEAADDRGRRTVGALYAANTLGAVAGALVPTFFAFEALGVRRTLFIAALLNLLVALAAHRLARALPEATEPSDGGEEGQAADWRDAMDRPASPAFVAVAAAVASFAFLLMEIVWYRMLAPLLGGSSYTFGLILAVALLGIGLGGLLYGAGGRARRPTLAALAVTCSAEALALAVPWAWGDGLAVFAALERHLAALGFGALTLSWAVVMAIVVLPAAIVSGYQFPLLVALLGTGRRELGREVGATAAANTLGAIVGSIAGGFGLLPRLGAPGAWRLAGGLLLALSAAALWVDRDRRRALALPAALGAAGLLLFAAPGPGPFWRHTPIGAGRVEARWRGPNDVRREVTERRRQIAWAADGVESSVALQVDEDTAFLINGKADGSALNDAPTQVMSGLVGALLHPHPRRSLVIGLGTGSTAGWLARVPTMERVDVVELEPAVVRVARDLAAVNQQVLGNPKVHLIVGDGREHLATSDETYDIIFSEPSNPYRAGIASLFSSEFYAAVRERLAPGGVFLQWLQGYEVDPPVVRTAFATLGTAFPAVESWEIEESDLLLVASVRPIAHDIDRVRRRVEEEPYRSALWNVWGVEGAEGLYAGFVAAPALARAFVAQEAGRLNTDDHPLLEYGFARNLGRTGLFSIATLRRLAASRGQDASAWAAGGPPLDGGRMGELRTVRRVYWGRLGIEPEAVAGDAIPRQGARQAYAQRDLDRACKLWLAQPEPPRSHLDLLLLGECLAATGDPRAPHYARELADHQPIEAGLIVALWQHARGQEAAAGRLLAGALTAYRADPWVHRPLAERALGLAVEIARRDPASAPTLFAALSQPFAVHAIDHSRLRQRLAMADISDRARHCAEALAPFEPNAPWEERLLQFRAACYTTLHHPLAEKARADLARFRRYVPAALDEGLIPPGTKPEG